LLLTAAHRLTHLNPLELKVIEIQRLELRELVRNQLARYHVQPSIEGRLSWGLTDAGRTISQRIKSGAL
jgi:hypothetical protein